MDEPAALTYEQARAFRLIRTPANPNVFEAVFMTHWAKAYARLSIMCSFDHRMDDVDRLDQYHIWSDPSESFIGAVFKEEQSLARLERLEKLTKAHAAVLGWKKIEWITKRYSGGTHKQEVTVKYDFS